MLVDRRVIARRPAGGVDGERLHPLAVQQQFQLVRLAQAFDVLVAVARQPDLDLVLAVLREGVADQRAAARAERQPFDVLLLREVRPECGTCRRRASGSALPTASRLIFCAAVM